jgi:hypothetical protein
MRKHITILGVLYIAFSVPIILAAIIVFISVTGGGLLSGEAEAIAITSTVGTVITYFLVLIALPGLLAGFGLLKFRPWSRILTLILGFLNLINIPIGTALGVYTIWVLMQDETEKILKKNENE